jgi:hypothetical protein
MPKGIYQEGQEGENRLDVVAHIWNPSFSGGKGRKICSPSKVRVKPYLKNKQKAKIWEQGSSGRI